MRHCRRVCFLFRLDHQDSRIPDAEAQAPGISTRRRVFENAKVARRVAHSRLRLVAVRVTLRSRNPVERLVRDGVLSEEEAQLGRMFLDVAHIVEL